MKKTLFTIILMFIIILTILVIMLINIKSNNMQLQQINDEYEYYTKKYIFGTELVTLINKAIDNNKKLGVEKDKDGFYINNYTNSILINIQMQNSEEPYQMEKIFALGTETFIELFNSSRFECIDVKYHKNTGRISEIIFKQIE